MVKLTKIKQYRAIKWYVQRDYSANEIQRRLKERGLGVRRKRLLAEVRSIKKIEITPEKRIKHIPKKYREKYIPPLPLIGEIYRVSVIIPSIPVHSRAFRRNYLGFRLTAFSYSRKLLYDKIRELKIRLIEKAGSFIKSKAYIEEFFIGVEYPVLISVSNPKFLNGKWFFAVEKEGKEQYGESGYL